MYLLDSILLRYIIYPCLALIPFLTLLVISGHTYSPFVTARSIGFRLLTEIMFMAWVLLAIREPRYRPQKNPLFISFAAFLAVQLLAAFFGEDFNKSFWSTLLRMEGIITYIHLLAYILVFSSVLRVHRLWIFSLNLHVAVGFILATMAIVEWLVSSAGYRAESLLGNSAFLATYSYFLVFISAILWLKIERLSAYATLLQIIYLLSAAVHLFLILLSGTRSAMLGLTGALVVMAALFFFVSREKNRIRRFVLVSLSIAVTAVVLLFIFRSSALVKESSLLSRITAATPGGAAAKIRIAAWKAGLEGTKEHPMLGWGAENFNLVMAKNFDPQLFNHANWFDRAHNIFLEWSVAGGIPGLLSFIALIVCFFWQVWQGRHGATPEEKILLTGLLSGYLVQGFFSFDSIISLILWATFAAFAASTRSVEFKQQDVSAPAKNDWRQVASVSMILLAVTGFLCYSVNYSVLRSSVLLAKARWQRFAEGPVGNLVLFQDLLNSKPFAKPEVVEEFFNFVTTGVNWNNLTPETRNAFFTLLIRELDEEIRRQPHDPRLLWFAAQTRLQLGDPAAAQVYMLKAKALAPRMPVILSTLAQTYFLSNDYTRAEEELRNLFELTPGYENARITYVQMLKMNGKHAEADRILRR